MSQPTPKHLENFFNRLYKLQRGERAVLARALNQDRPSSHVPAFGIVERFVGDKEQGWRRDCYYLVAALFGKLEKETPKERPTGQVFAKAVKAYSGKESSGDGLSPTERRFLALLDSDSEELPYRLRQLTSMITTGSNRVQSLLDWPSLLQDLTKWNFESRATQKKWAQEFYRNETKEEKE